MRTLVVVAFTVPTDYQPQVIGHILNSDRFCLFWCVWFILESTRSSPQKFVEEINGLSVEGTLQQTATRMLTYPTCPTFCLRSCNRSRPRASYVCVCLRCSLDSRRVNHHGGYIHPSQLCM